MTSSAIIRIPWRSHSSRTPARYPSGGTSTPFVPTTDSSTIAATVCGPSICTTSARCASARSHSCSSVAAPNEERYGYGPKKCTTPGAPGSDAQRRGSPVSVIAVAVAPW